MLINIILIDNYIREVEIETIRLPFSFPDFLKLENVEL